MNSISALLGKFDSLSTNFQFESQGKRSGRSVGNDQEGRHQTGRNKAEHHQGRQHDAGHHKGRSSSSQPALYEVSLSFSSSSVSSHDKGVKVLEQELEVRFSGARFSKTAAPFVPEIKPPSADEVANNVLGFIENRIKQEADSGASPERIDDLLSQARSGVEQGFGEALEQIEKIGLMTAELSEGIDQSFKKINIGIDDLVTKYVVAQPDDSDSEEAAPVAANQNKVSEKEDVAVQVESPSVQNRGVSAGYSSFSALSESAAIQITTQDGDVVSFNLEQIQASFEQGELSGDRFGFESTQMAGQYASGSYSYSVDGELDEGEIEALNQLMVQIEGMSDQFFSGDFQGAFQSAMELGFDSQEIAGFSVNLSQTSIQQVSAYQQVAGLEGDRSGDGGGDSVATSGRFDPLSQFFDSLQAAFDKANTFSQPADLVSSLFDRVIDDILANEHAALDGAEASTPLEQMREYVHALLENM